MMFISVYILSTTSLVHERWQYFTVSKDEFIIQNRT